ncbi:hypothetical protein ANN_18912 [Periplaneta americana]|uniref:Tc1-like transposase DDE domain-containing protein n=1 Tax=Periplaneta americana TaxID=6978 RepID=A0ABQ8SRB1_PERAM|nr:hypothetical protein ANN_18912 [Periplaneta americana]
MKKDIILQDNTTARSALCSVIAICEYFDDCSVGHNKVSQVPLFESTVYLCRKLKDRVYENNPLFRRLIYDIRDEILNILFHKDSLSEDVIKKTEDLNHRDDVGSHVVFQQDNHPVHTANHIQKWFMRRSDVDLLKWPPNSPDMNVIENVWARLKKILHSNWAELPIEQQTNCGTEY